LRTAPLSTTANPRRHCRDRRLDFVETIVSTARAWSPVWQVTRTIARAPTDASTTAAAEGIQDDARYSGETNALQLIALRQ
jgi:hypothetical protein